MNFEMVKESMANTVINLLKHNANKCIWFQNPYGSYRRILAILRFSELKLKIVNEFCKETRSIQTNIKEENNADIFYGIVLLETSAKAYRIANDKFRGIDQNELIGFEVVRHISHAEHQVFPKAIMLTFPPHPSFNILREGVVLQQMQMCAKLRSFFLNYFEKLNQHFEHNSYMVGHWMTLADITQAVALLPIYLDTTKCILILDSKFPHFYFPILSSHKF
ncbi:translation elongation factor [Blomia tropicalis]|nr:translation elongation factor [Blomia tropicalis]